MAIFTAYDHAEILTALQDAAPHAEIHTDDKIAREHSANGNAQQEIAGHILAYIAVGDVPDIQGVLKVARQYHIPVVAQGADTSTVIGADGLDGSIILSTAQIYHCRYPWA